MKQTDQSERRSLRRTAVRALAPLLWMAIIFGFSAQEGDDLNAMLPFFRRFFPGMESFDWGHLAAYFVLALLLEYAAGLSALRLRTKLVVVLLCVAYGVTDEYHQSFVGGRMMDPHDLLNDGIGAAAAVLFTAIPAVRKRWIKLLR